MPYKYRDLMWSEMTDRQKTLAGSKSEHKAAKKAYEERQSTPTPTPAPAPSPTPTPTPSPTSDWGDGNTLTGPINNPETPTAGKPPAANEAKERAKKNKLPFGLMTFEPVPVMFFNKNTKNHRINSLHQ